MLHRNVCCCCGRGAVLVLSSGFWRCLHASEAWCAVLLFLSFYPPLVLFVKNAKQIEDTIPNIPRVNITKSTKKIHHAVTPQNLDAEKARKEEPQNIIKPKTNTIAALRFCHKGSNTPQPRRTARRTQRPQTP